MLLPLYRTGKKLIEFFLEEITDTIAFMKRSDSQARTVQDKGECDSVLVLD